MKKNVYFYLFCFLSISCSKDPVEPACSQKVKADLFNVSMKVDQADDHHFIVTTQVTNLSKGSCAEASIETYGKLKVYFANTPTVDESNALVYEKTFALSSFTSLEKRSLVELLNLHELGYYLFVWTLDHQNIVDEADESNNTILRTHWKQT